MHTEQRTKYTQHISLFVMMNNKECLYVTAVAKSNARKFFLVIVSNGLNFCAFYVVSLRGSSELSQI